MPIETIVTYIDLTADEPFRKRLFPLQHFFPGLEPYQLVFRLLSPKLFGRANGLLIKFLVLRQGFNVGAFGKLFGAGKNAVFVKNGVEARCFVVSGHKLRESWTHSRKLP